MLKLTLASGETVEVPFTPRSTLTVENHDVENGRTVTRPQSFSEVVAVAHVDDTKPARKAKGE